MFCFCFNKFHGAVIVSNPWDLMKVDEVMLSRPLSSVYSRLLVIELKDYLKRFLPSFSSKQFLVHSNKIDYLTFRHWHQISKHTNAGQEEYEAALRAITVGDFDDAIVAPLFGFKDRLDYYHHSSSCRYADKIAIPTITGTYLTSVMFLHL